MVPGSIDALRSEENEKAKRSTVSVKPLRGVTLMAEVPEAPWATVMVAGLEDREKPGPRMYTDANIM